MSKPMSAEEAREAAAVITGADTKSKATLIDVAATLRAYADMLDGQSGDVRERVAEVVYYSRNPILPWNVALDEYRAAVYKAADRIMALFPQQDVSGLVEALEIIAKQLLPDEMEPDSGCFESGYTAVVRVARQALSAYKGDRDE